MAERLDQGDSQPLDTTFSGTKRLSQRSIDGLWPMETPLNGFELHYGTTTPDPGLQPLSSDPGLGWWAPGPPVVGTYLHGLLDNGLGGVVGSTGFASNGFAGVVGTYLHGCCSTTAPGDGPGSIAPSRATGIVRWPTIPRTTAPTVIIARSPWWPMPSSRITMEPAIAPAMTSIPVRWPDGRRQPTKPSARTGWWPPVERASAFPPVAWGQLRGLRDRRQRQDGARLHQHRSGVEISETQR